MQTIKLSQVMQANKWLRLRKAEAKRERKRQQWLRNKLTLFAIDEFPGFVEELSKLDEYRRDERS